MEGMWSIDIHDMEGFFAVVDYAGFYVFVTFKGFSNGDSSRN